LQHDIDVVRKRPGMYIGPTDDGSGLHRMVFEVVENAVDEALSGYADLIEIALNAGGWVTVWDNGRGIPVDVDENEWLSIAELVMTRLHAGGRFGQSAHKVSGGLHGVGVCVVNALSETLELRIWRDDAEWFMRFHHGVAEAALDWIGPANGRAGTEIRFKPSPQIFARTDFDFATIERHVRGLAALKPGLRAVLADKRGSEPRRIDIG
jgi:DNA gyrase subunit B